MSKPARALRTLRRPPHRRHCVAVRVWGVGSKPGQAPPPPTGTAARPTNPSGALHTGVAVSLCVAECVGSKPGQAPLPPTAAAARPTNPSGGLHTGGTVSLCVAGTLTATP